jgi:hypothetical protein
MEIQIFGIIEFSQVTIPIRIIRESKIHDRAAAISDQKMRPDKIKQINNTPVKQYLNPSD